MKVVDSYIIVARFVLIIFFLGLASSCQPREVEDVETADERNDSKEVKPAQDRVVEVLAMKPVGYWPVDSGEGNVLKDLSVTSNNGEIVYVPWEEDRKLLNFSGGYQWLQIPANPVYQTDSFSLGGWVFLRSEVVGSGWPNRQGMLFFGNEDWLNQVGIQLCIRKQELLDVVSNGKEDVLQTRLWVDRRGGKMIRKGLGEPSLPLGTWQHLSYTFQSHENQPGLPESFNLAKSAKLTVSNHGGHSIRSPQNMLDGKNETNWIIWPGAGPRPDHEQWFQLNFEQEVTLNRIRLIGRTGRTDYFIEGKLSFSDGTTMDVPSLVEGWDVIFPTKNVTWVRFEANRTVGLRPGLAEIGVYKEADEVFLEEGVLENPVIGDGVVGTGTLYLNGRALKSKDDIVYRPANRPLMSGNDAYWWHQIAGKSGSLNGTVRDLYWFDRALSEEEVARLVELTKPDVSPITKDDTFVVGAVPFKHDQAGGRDITWEDWTSLSGVERREFLQRLTERDAKFKIQYQADLQSILKESLIDPETRLAAVRLLISMPPSTEVEAMKKEALSLCLETLQNEEVSTQLRASSVLAMTSLGKFARPALPELEAALQKRLPEGEASFPGVEEHLRNALIQALIALKPTTPTAAELLGKALIYPYLQLLGAADDLKEEIKQLLEKGQTEAALKRIQSLSRAEDSPAFFTQRDVGPKGDYTGTAQHQGAIYRVGTGVAWEGVEKISPQEYQKVLNRRAGKGQKATSWRSLDFPHLYRVPVSKTGPDGKTETIYLEGEDFVLDGHDAKVRGWSIFIDDRGYIHLMGGQHNTPHPDYFIPGSWEDMGLSRDKTSPDFPAQMYWVSQQPGDIHSLEFAGRRSDPRSVPAEYLNYLVFLQNPEQVTYLYGRSNAHGFQSWGMFRYDSEEKRWSPVGGDAMQITKNIQATMPDWLGRARDSIRGRMPSQPTKAAPLVWAWQPAFYNFCRDNWGARFDATGRMHLHMQIAGLTEGGYHGLSGIYAWSDDLGKTFYRADGSQVQLPLTVNPALKHQANIRQGGQLEWWNLWTGLLKELGVQLPRPSSL